MDRVLLLATWLFIATNLDKLVVLVAFLLDEDYRIIEVLIGHFTGVLVGLGATVIGVTLATAVLQEWTFLLGLIPIGIGVWSVFRGTTEGSSRDRETTPRAAGRIGVVTATAIGLNGENLAVYIPFFAGLSSDQLLQVLGLYLLLAGVVFLVALGLARSTAVVRRGAWVDRWLVPIVLVLVGGYVLATGWIAR